MCILHEVFWLLYAWPAGGHASESSASRGECQNGTAERATFPTESYRKPSRSHLAGLHFKIRPLESKT